MKHSVLRCLPGLCPLTAATAFFTACGDDDFAPVSRNRGYDYAFTSTKEFAEYPCNDVREGREAIVGRDKDSYYCEFDSRDSVYIWIGDTDTLTAEGREFHRAESSSSSYRSSSSYSYEEVFNPDIDYGPMTDPRDGKTYRTVVVNGQLWMAENLNYSGNNVGKAPCYNNRDSLCAQFGRLYSRDAAMDDSRCEYLSSCDLGEGPIQGICPDGWHIPTVEEMEDLVNFVGDYAPRYKSMGSTWSYNDGTDTYGLSFLGAGNWDSDDGFEDIIPISARTGDGLEDLMKQLEKYAQEGPQLFPDGMTTDQPDAQVCAEMVREKMLHCLDKEIPHGTAVEVTRFTERVDTGIIDLDVTIYCEKASHKGIIIGKHGDMLKKISSMARADCEKFMGTRVYLTTWVKVKENWRDSDFLVRNFGYRE